MEIFCAIYKNNTANKNFNVNKIDKKSLNLVLNCVILGKKKSRFIKISEANEFSINLEIRTPLINISLLMIFYFKVLVLL